MIENKYEKLKFDSIIKSKREEKEAFSINWHSDDLGFGQVTFDYDINENKLHIDSECMSKEFVKELLCRMVDNSEFK